MNSGILVRLGESNLGIHPVYQELIAILNVFPLQFECCCNEVQIWCPNFGNEFDGLRNFKLLKAAFYRMFLNFCKHQLFHLCIAAQILDDTPFNTI